MNKNYLFYIVLFYSNIGYSQESPCNQEPESNIGDTGCVTLLYNGIETTYTTVRATDGKIWIQQNLGSETVATSATDTDSFGDLFQWGRWDDGHQLRDSEVSSTTPNPNNPLGLAGGNVTFYLSSPEWWDGGTTTDTWQAKTPENVTENNGCDPCKALGQGWRLPTEAEWETVIEAENITNIATAYQSNLKLAVAGTRSSNTISNAGVRGYYWSSTVSTTNTSYSKYLYYSNAIVNPNAGGFREQGSSVRCILDKSDYCAVSVDYDVEPITLVSFADIYNETSAIVNETPAYEDFTEISTDVEKGATYNLIVKGNTINFEHDIRVFLDWNQDKVFDMETEFYTVSLLPSTGEDDVVASLDITIPTNAPLGTTRMRIIKDQWNIYEEGEFDACLNAYYGQAEDYTLNIQENLGTGGFIKNSLSIYPNPTTDFVTIQTESAIKSIQVFNPLGQLITAQKEANINLSGVAKGIYLVQVTLEDNSIVTQKIIKK